jgi:Concanavalin A-like lectin/glucanases superfamily/Calcineurin-like phosphoesterase
MEWNMTRLHYVVQGEDDNSAFPIVKNQMKMRKRRRQTVTQQKRSTSTTSAAAVAAAPANSNKFRLVILPDTQYYSEGCPEIFVKQTQWIVDHSDHINFVIHLGDLVQNPSRDVEWTVADTAMAILEQGSKPEETTNETTTTTAAATTTTRNNFYGGVPYSVCVGNHDLIDEGMNDESRQSKTEKYLDVFSRQRASLIPTFGEKDDFGYSEYHIVDLITNSLGDNSGKILILSLDWRASNSTLVWANNLLQQQYPNTPTILVSHEFLHPSDTSSAVERTTYGQSLWDNFVKSNDNIFMVLCGHISASRHLTSANNYGHDVHQILVNFQSLHAGGNGYMRVVEWEWDFLTTTTSTMKHYTFSPFVLELYKTGGYDELGPNDIAVLDDDENQFNINFDFEQRFPNINWSQQNATTTDEADSSSLVKLIRNETAIVPLPLNLIDRWKQPTDEDDYPFIEEDTVAHWRFRHSGDDDVTNTPVLKTDIVADITGNGNNMIVYDTIDLLQQEDFLTWSDDHHVLSSSPNSICFQNPSREIGRYFATVPGEAPIEQHRFLNGFTIEAFVKLSSSWDTGFWRWTGIVSRTNSGRDAFKTDGDIDEPLALVGVSPLREIQFASFPDNLDGIVTSWSSPLDVDTWYHVAAVNDGQSTRLFVDGFPTRRDPVHEPVINGIAKPKNGTMTKTNEGWSIGSATYGGSRKVFGGCIGEVRIASRALKPDEFLLARRAPLEESSVFSSSPSVQPFTIFESSRTVEQSSGCALANHNSIVTVAIVLWMAITSIL